MHHQESHSLESRLLWLHICSCSGGPFSNFYRSRLHLLRWGSKLPGIQAHPKVLAGCGWITPSPPSPWQQQTLICMYFQGGGEADARPSSVENAGWKLVNSIIQKIINSKVLEIDSDGGDLGAAERIAAVFFSQVLIQKIYLTSHNPAYQENGWRGGDLLCGCESL